MTEEDLVIYRRRLLHWRLTGSVYFITWRLAPSQTELTSKERGEIMSALRHFDGSRYELFAGVVMHDHVHVLIKPLEENPLQDIIHAWKSFTAHKFRQEFGRKAPVWQDEYFDRIVRDERELLDKAQYIFYNPLKTWPEVEDYPWVWVKQE
ncbi:MAG: REP-associated tyrosine transposase [Desulfobaccales bacterium]